MKTREEQFKHYIFKLARGNGKSTLATKHFIDRITELQKILATRPSEYLTICMPRHHGETYLRQLFSDNYMKGNIQR